jgi:hypothetical protein
VCISLRSTFSLHLTSYVSKLHWGAVFISKFTSFKQAHGLDGENAGMLGVLQHVACHSLFHLEYPGLELTKLQSDSKGQVTAKWCLRCHTCAAERLLGSCTTGVNKYGHLLP